MESNSFCNHTSEQQNLRDRPICLIANMIADRIGGYESRKYFARSKNKNKRTTITKTLFKCARDGALITALLHCTY